MKSKKILIAVVAVIIVASFLFIRGNKEDGQIKIGVISTMSGDYAFVGDSFLKGVQLAQDEWNNNNPNKQISIVVEDDGFVSAKSVSAYKKIVEIDKVDGLVNMSTITIDAIYDDVVYKKIPVAQGFIQGIPEKDDNIVQVWPGSRFAERKLGEYIREQGFKNVAVLIDNRSSAFAISAEAFKEGYGSSVTEFNVSSDTTELRSAALKISELKPDAIMFIVQADQGAVIIKELNKLSSERQQFVFDANLQGFFENYRTLLGDMNLLNGSIMYVTPVDYSSEFTKKYKEKYSAEPGIGSETGYNAFKLIATSYNSDTDKWIENMKNSTFDGADGKVMFDEFGVRIPSLKIGTIQNGELPK